MLFRSGATMRAAMILLAAACLGIGLWPEPFIKTMAVGLHELAGLTGHSTDFLGSIPGNLALAARLCLAALVFMALIRHLLYRGKPIERTVTWGCGFTQASSRVQYTGVSFARSLVDFHRPLVKVETSYTGIDKIYPESARFGSRVADLAEIGLQRLLIDPLLGLVERLRWIQHGQIQLYIGYIVFTIAVLLLVID